MKYLMLIKHAEASPSPAIPQALMDAMGEFVSKGFSSGTLKDTAGLKPTRDGYRIRSAGGKLQATDGPFTETKEVVGGYALVEVTSEEQAREIAQQFMELGQQHMHAPPPSTQEATAPSHPVGRLKARFFTGLGFDQTRWAELDEALRRQHLTQDAQLAGRTTHGH